MHESTKYKILSLLLTYPEWRNVNYTIMGEGQNVPRPTWGNFTPRTEIFQRTASFGLAFITMYFVSV
jgi:hypothetical protein